MATVRQRFRPLRFGFLVDPAKPATIRSAIDAASITWGGRFAPLIPRFRNKIEWDLGRELRPKEIVLGLLTSFEPDVLVTTDNQRREAYGYPDSRIIDISNFFATPFEERRGLAMHFVYNALYETEFQFERRHPRQLRVHRSEERSLFEAACFGSIRDSEVTHLRGLEELGAIEEEISPNTFIRQLRETFGPLRLTTELLELSQERSTFLFILDPGKVIDVIDYWNLRALGKRVLPIPASWWPQVSQTVSDIVAREHAVSPKLQPWVTQAVLVKARSVADAVFGQIASDLGSRGASTNFTSKREVPRLFPPRERGWDRMEPWRPFSLEATSTVHALERINVEIPRPEWLPTGFGLFGDSRKFCVATEIAISRAPLLAQVIPPGLPEIAQLLGAWGGRRDEAWTATEGIVQIVGDLDAQNTFVIPTGYEVVEAWFWARGIPCKVSSAGRLTMQMKERLPTAFDVHTVMRSELLPLFGKAARSSTRDLSYGALWSTLSRLHKGRRDVAERHFNNILELEVLKPGMRALCSHCGQANWYAFDSLRNPADCERCLQRFPLALVHPPGTDSWSFRLRGPFAVEGGALGAFAVLRTLAAIEGEHIFRRTTWASGVEIELAGDACEIDLVMNLQPSSISSPWAQVVAFGECKSGGVFGDKAQKGRGEASRFRRADITRAAQLAKKFPDAYFIFSTLAEELSPAEVRLIARFVKSQRAARRGPVLVLSANELFGGFGILDSWRDRDDADVIDIVKRLDYAPSLRAVCEASTKLKLGIDPTPEWPNVDDLGFA
jgi:hypothetical protein